jgi:excisionase family DNA binding protein
VIWRRNLLTVDGKSLELKRMTTDEQTRLEPLTVTVQEARRLTGLGNTTLYRLIGEGKLRTVKVGARTLVIYQSIKALIERATPVSSAGR